MAVQTDTAQVGSASYEAEIREYLLGRVSRDRSIDRSASSEFRFRYPRLMNWWIFEGKRYHGMDGPIAHNWLRIERTIRRLRATPSATWRNSAHHDGEIDWLA